MRTASSTFDVVVGIEARGFVIAAAVAYASGLGVVPVRKAGKLPREVYAASYALEYGEATLEVHTDAFSAGQRVLVVDDVLATGGTAEATLGLVERAGGSWPGCAWCWSWRCWAGASADRPGRTRAVDRLSGLDRLRILDRSGACWHGLRGLSGRK